MQFMHLSRYLIATYAFICKDNYILCNYSNIYYNGFKYL